MPAVPPLWLPQITARKRARDALKKVLDFGCNLITNAAKGGQTLLFASLDTAGIRKTPMDLMTGIWEEGTRLLLPHRRR